MSRRITPVENSIHISPISTQEIKGAVFQMDSSKAQGLDTPDTYSF